MPSCGLNHHLPSLPGALSRYHTVQEACENFVREVANAYHLLLVLVQTHLRFRVDAGSYLWVWDLQRSCPCSTKNSSWKMSENDISLTILQPKSIIFWCKPVWSWLETQQLCLQNFAPISKFALHMQAAGLSYDFTGWGVALLYGIRHIEARQLYLWNWLLFIVVTLLFCRFCLNLLMLLVSFMP